jgi:hypothetical protein
MSSALSKYLIQQGLLWPPTEEFSLEPAVCRFLSGWCRVRHTQRRLYSNWVRVANLCADLQ